MRHLSWHLAHCLRNEAGQGLVETALTGVIFIALAIATAVLVLDAGLIMSHKLKLQALVLNAAQYAATLSADDQNFDQKVRDYVHGHFNRLDLYKTMFSRCPRRGIVVASVGASRIGFGNAGPPFTVTTSRDPEFRTVTIKVRDLPLFAGFSFLPSKIDLEDTEASTPSLAANGYVMLEWQRVNGAPATITEPARPAFLPILDQTLIDPTKPQFMLDTYNYPLTHVICHGVFHGAAPETSFPIYRGGAGNGSRAPLSSREAYVNAWVTKMYAADTGNSLWEYPKVICVPGRLVGTPCPPPPPPPPPP